MSDPGHRLVAGSRLLLALSVATAACLLPSIGRAQPSEWRREAQRARGYSIAGQCNLAIPVFDRAIALAPGQAELLRERGACHELLGDRQAAVADYTAYCAAVPTAPDVPALRQRIAALRSSRPPSAAVVPVPAQPTGDPGYVPPVVIPPSERPEPAEVVEEAPRHEGRIRRISDPVELDRAPNSVFVEGLGAGMFYSLNYERLVIDDLGVRVGFSYMPLSAASISASYLIFPVTASYIGLHSGRHALEIGGGVTVVYATGSVSGLGLSASGSGAAPLGTVLLGYRLHPAGGAGFQFRIGVMAIIGEGVSFSSNGTGMTSIGALPWPYLSLGASF